MHLCWCGFSSIVSGYIIDISFFFVPCCSSIACSCVSAPGKVLLAGGYAILDSKNAGYSIATTARAYCTVGPGCAVQSQDITFLSPQFDLVIKYTVEFTEDEVSGNAQYRLLGVGTNPFVDRAVWLCVALATTFHTHRVVRAGLARQGGLVVEVLMDNDFYSADHFEDAFIPFSKPDEGIADVTKTGLGSSAALTTAVCCALLRHLSVIGPWNGVDETSNEQYLALGHIVAQAVHMSAQGKVGSGFDVASAVYGSIVYHTFSGQARERMDMMLKLMEKFDAPWSVSEASVTDGIAAAARMLLEMATTSMAGMSRAERVVLPRGLGLVLGCINVGSSTPGMVRKVLQWTRANPDSAIWQSLLRGNEFVMAGLRLLACMSETTVHAYDSALVIFAAGASSSEQGEAVHMEDRTVSHVLATLNKLKMEFQQVRRAMKRLGMNAGVETEPDIQTALLDETMHVDGVIGCGVPGAGGFDAAFAIIVDTPAVRMKLCDGWQQRNVVPLTQVGADVEGIRDEPEQPVMSTSD